MGERWEGNGRKRKANQQQIEKWDTMGEQRDLGGTWQEHGQNMSGKWKENGKNRRTRKDAHKKIANFEHDGEAMGVERKWE